VTRPRLVIAAPYVALWLVVVAAYPSLRGDPLLSLYGAAEAAGGVFVVGCFAAGQVRPRYGLGRIRIDTDTSPWSNSIWPHGTTACALALTSASLATTLLPALWGPAMVAGWPVVVTVWCVALGLVLGVQLVEILSE
jgi:hypothetical protein